MDNDFTSPISKSLVVIAAVFEGLATAIVALRFYLRVKLKQGVKWDDWLALLSLVASWAYEIGVFIVAAQIGVDTAKVNPLYAAKKWLEAVEIGTIILPFIIAPIKISVLLFYKRIFSSRVFNRWVWAFSGLITAWGIVVFIGNVLSCYPRPSSAWEDLPNLRYRFDVYAFNLFVPISSVVLDGIVLIFPLPSLKKLQVPMKKKIAILGVFWLGSFVLVTGSVRSYYWYKNAHAFVNPNDTNLNKWHYDTLIQIWVLLEITVTVIAACLPTLAPVLHSSIYVRFAQQLSSLSSSLLGRSASNSYGSSHVSHKSSGAFQRFGSSDATAERDDSLPKDRTWAGIKRQDRVDVDISDIEMAHIPENHSK